MVQAQDTQKVLSYLEKRLEEENGYEIWKPAVNQVISGVIENIVWQKTLKNTNRLWVVLRSDENRLVKIKVTKRLESYVLEAKLGWLAAFKCVRKVGTSYELKAVIAAPDLKTSQDLYHLKVF